MPYDNLSRDYASGKDFCPRSSRVLLTHQLSRLVSSLGQHHSRCRKTRLLSNSHKAANTRTLLGRGYTSTGRPDQRSAPPIQLQSRLADNALVPAPELNPVHKTGSASLPAARCLPPADPSAKAPRHSSAKINPNLQPAAEKQQPNTSSNGAKAQPQKAKIPDQSEPHQRPKTTRQSESHSPHGKSNNDHFNPIRHRCRPPAETARVHPTTRHPLGRLRPQPRHHRLRQHRTGRPATDDHRPPVHDRNRRRPRLRRPPGVQGIPPSPRRRLVRPGRPQCLKP